MEEAREEACEMISVQMLQGSIMLPFQKEEEFR